MLRDIMTFCGRQPHKKQLAEARARAQVGSVPCGSVSSLEEFSLRNGAENVSLRSLPGPDFRTRTPVVTSRFRLTQNVRCRTTNNKDD